MNGKIKNSAVEIANKVSDIERVRVENAVIKCIGKIGG